MKMNQKPKKIKYNFDELIQREETNSVKYDLRKYYFGTSSLQPMWVADMDFATPPFIRDAVISRAKHPIYGYSVRPESFNDSIRQWMKKRFDWNIKNNWMSFSPGIVPGINLCILAFTRPGEGVLVQPPVYFPFFSAITNHNRSIHYNQLIEKDNLYSIDFEDMEEKAAKASVFILCHPHNPVGRVWKTWELQKMAEICNKHKVLIISDEIHSDLMLNGNRHIPLATLGESIADQSITCIAPSKTFNLAGLSTSMLIIPNKSLKARYDEVLENVHVGAGNIFGDTALESAYTHGEEWLSQMISYLEANLDFLTKFIQTRIPELIITPLEATYLVWIDFRGLGMENNRLKEFLCYQAGIGLSDGTTFGPGGDGFHRMNIAVPRIKLEEALLKLENAIIALRKEKSI